MWVVDGKSVTNGTFNLATTSNFTFRLDGEAAGARLGFSGLTKNICDLNGNGKPDLVIGAYAETVRSKGSVYVIYDDVIDRFFTDGQVSYSMANNANYSFRIDGVATGDSFGRAIYCNDYDGNGKDDLYISATQTDYTGSGSGSLYIIRDALFSAFPSGSVQTLTNNTGFTLRIDGAAANDVFAASLLIHDFNNDSQADLVIGASETSDVSAARLGMYYLIDSSKYVGYTTEGNVVSVVSGNNIYNAKFTFSDRYYMGRLDAVAANFTDENSSDIILISDLGGYPAEYRGYVYIIPSSVVLNNYITTEKDISLDDPANYFLKIYGEPSTPYYNGYQEIGRGAGVRIVDVNSDGLDDLVISASWSHYAAYQSGSLIIIDHAAIVGLEGNGHSLTPSDLMSRRYDGGYRHFVGDDLVVTDLDGDGSNDLFIGAQGTDYVASNAGSVYVVYNFPHTLTLDPLQSPTNQKDQIITGSIVATNSVTNITGVEYSFSSNPLGTWTSCGAVDGAFNSTSEQFTCNLEGVSDGVYTIYVRAYDTNTSYTPQSRYGQLPLTVDTAAPSGSISTNNNESYATSTLVNLAISSSDVTTSVVEMMISNSADFAGATWEAYATTKDWTLTSGDGTKTVYIKFKDLVGNESSVYSDTVILDTTAPVDELKINGGIKYTNKNQVTLTLLASDTTSSVTSMLVSENSSFAGAAWEPFVSTKTLTLSAGDGLKNVYVKYKDTAGNVSSVYSASITLDTTLPTLLPKELNTLRMIEKVFSYYYTTGKRLKISGITEAFARVVIEVRSDPVTCETDADANGNFTCEFTSEIPMGYHTIKIAATDIAGNVITYPDLTLGVRVGLAETGSPAGMGVSGGSLLLAGLWLIRKRYI